MKSKPGEVISSPKLTLFKVMTPRARGQSVLAVLFGLEGFLTMSAVRAESFASVLLGDEVGLKPRPWIKAAAEVVK